MIEAFEIDGLLLITPKKFGDERGFFSETYNKKLLAEAGIYANFVQDNHSLTVGQGVVRGLHFQTPPHAQGKLVRITRGSALDVAVDIRKGSPTYGKHVAMTLSADDWRQLWIPPGFAHGFCTLEPDTEILYKVTDYYHPESESGLAWDDPDLHIPWPVDPDNVILSDKDKTQPSLARLPDYFVYSDRH
jgi:dTDP-4-dehydrorhamnose 3,5-epimerase